MLLYRFVFKDILFKFFIMMVLFVRFLNWNRKERFFFQITPREGGIYLSLLSDRVLRIFNYGWCLYRSVTRNLAYAASTAVRGGGQWSTIVTGEADPAPWPGSALPRTACPSKSRRRQEALWAIIEKIRNFSLRTVCLFSIRELVITGVRMFIGELSY